MQKKLPQPSQPHGCDHRVFHDFSLEEIAKSRYDDRNAHGLTIEEPDLIAREYCVLIYLLVKDIVPHIDASIANQVGQGMSLDGVITCGVFEVAGCIFISTRRMASLYV